MHTSSTRAELDRILAERLAGLIEYPAFQHINQQLTRFNPFKVLRVERYELRHTNTLAWLFDPRGSHGLGSAFLDQFLAKHVSFDAALISEEAEVRTELKLRKDGSLVPNDDASANEAPATGDRLDILVEGRDGNGLPWAIAVEAKIDSKEGDEQLRRYDGGLAKRVADGRVAKFFLTIAPTEVMSSEVWTNICWTKDVGDALAAALAAGPRLDPHVQRFLEDYHQLMLSLYVEEGVRDDEVYRLANRDDIAPILRTLAKRIKDKKHVHSWDREPWAAVYRRYKTAFDACIEALRHAGALLVWKMVQDQLANTPDWEILTSRATKTRTVRFVPRPWNEVAELKSAKGKWNLFYSLQFRPDKRDIEIKLHVAPPGDIAMQRRLMQRLFGPALAQQRPDDHLVPDLKELQKFVNGGASVKLYRQWVKWNEDADGAFHLDPTLHDKLADFRKAVKCHTEAFLALNDKLQAAA